MNKAQILIMIDDVETKLHETRASMAWNSGPVNDCVKLMVPMMLDQIKILRAMLDLVTE